MLGNGNKRPVSEKKMAGSARGKSFQQRGSTFFTNKTRSQIIFGNLWQFISRCFGTGAGETVPSFTLAGRPPRRSPHAAFIRTGPASKRGRDKDAHADESALATALRLTPMAGRS